MTRNTPGKTSNTRPGAQPQTLILRSKAQAANGPMGGPARHVVQGHRARLRDNIHT